MLKLSWYINTNYIFHIQFQNNLPVDCRGSGKCLSITLMLMLDIIIVIITIAIVLIITVLIIVLVVLIVVNILNPNTQLEKAKRSTQKSCLES